MFFSKTKDSAQGSREWPRCKPLCHTLKQKPTQKIPTPASAVTPVVRSLRKNGMNTLFKPASQEYRFSITDARKH